VKNAILVELISVITLPTQVGIKLNGGIYIIAKLKKAIKRDQCPNGHAEQGKKYTVKKSS